MLIGITGKRGVGKTTLANHFRKFGYRRFSIADSLRDYGDVLFPGLSKSEKEVQFKPYFWTPRVFYIEYGRFIRSFDRNLLLNHCIAKAIKEKKVVIDDVRFPLEYDTIKRLGGKILRIERYWKYNPYKKPLNDPSETSLDSHKADYTIFKDRNITLKDLFVEGEWALTTWGMK